MAGADSTEPPTQGLDGEADYRHPVGIRSRAVWRARGSVENHRPGAGGGLSVTERLIPLGGDRNVRSGLRCRYSRPRVTGCYATGGERVANLVEIRDLSIEFDNRGTMVPALDRISFGIPPGSTVALVGESGSGKSVTAQAIMGILPKTARISSGEILFSAPGSTHAQVDITRLDPDGAAIRAIRGRHISMIFQEPMVSLSPLHKVGDQVSEALFLHHKVGHAEGMRQTEEMLRLVGFPNPAR